MPHHTHEHDHGPTDLLPQLLALDGIIHASVVDRALEFLARYVADADIATVMDIGAGTGAATFTLAARYPRARVVAVDVDPDMLERVRHGAVEQQVASRISTVCADIGDAAFDAGSADVIWTSNVMHEVGDPAAALRNMFRSLRCGGVLLVLEMDAPPAVLPPEYAPLETALRAAAGADDPGPDWSAAITGAGFDLLDTRSLASEQVLPADGPGGAYAALELRRLARHTHSALTDDAVAELRSLVSDLAGRHDLLDRVFIRGTRTLWVARRP